MNKQKKKRNDDEITLTMFGFAWEAFIELLNKPKIILAEHITNRKTSIH